MWLKWNRSSSANSNTASRFTPFLLQTPSAIKVRNWSKASKYNKFYSPDLILSDDYHLFHSLSLKNSLSDVEMTSKATSRATCENHLVQFFSETNKAPLERNIVEFRWKNVTDLSLSQSNQIYFIAFLLVFDSNVPNTLYLWWPSNQSNQKLAIKRNNCLLIYNI